MNAFKTFKSVACSAAIAGLLALASNPASAAGVNVSSSSPAWNLLPNSIGNGGAGTWGLPANLTSIGCGTENEPTCEPTGIFKVTDTFTGGLGFYTLLSADGTLGDVIGISNVGGQGQIAFWSDPTLPQSLTALGTALGVLCTESVASGCIGTFALTTTNGTILSIDVASDGEQVFDPFGYGFDTSDQIRFSGQGVTVVPEPGSLALLGLALAGVAYSRRRKA